MAVLVADPQAKSENPPEESEKPENPADPPENLEENPTKANPAENSPENPVAKLQEKPKKIKRKKIDIEFFNIILTLYKVRSARLQRNNEIPFSYINNFNTIYVFRYRWFNV